MMKSLLVSSLMILLLTACGESGTPTAPSSTTMATEKSDNPYQTAAFSVADIPQADLSYTPAADKQIFYYNTKGYRSNEPEENGYYREVLGQMADGRTVVQDFYQNTQKPQNAPFPIMKNGDISKFDASVIDGRVIRYHQKDGSITSVAHYQNGKQQGWLNVYELNRLVVQLKDHGDNGFDVRFFSPEDQTWGEAYIYSSNAGKLDLRELVLYRANGQVLTTMQNGKDGQKSIITYDESGKMVSDVATNSQLNETLLRRFASVVQKLPSLMAR